jgi:RNA polymerase sigma-70 factor (ECF subfamily)
MNEASDETVLLQAVGGDNEAFNQLYESYVGRIYNYIYYRTGSQHDAEDITSKVFFRAFNHIREYKLKGVPFSAWLYRIAHNLVANWYRDRSRKREVPLEDMVHLSHRGEHAEYTLVKTQESENLMKVIQKFVEGLSNVEIAVIMRRSEGAIKSLYHRTLLSLRDSVDEDR